MSYQQEALTEACMYAQQEEKMAMRLEMLLAHAVAARQRGEQPCNEWLRKAETVLRLRNHDRKERADV